MALELLPDNWLRFGHGRKWRCGRPDYLCEIDDPGNVPSYRGQTMIEAKIRRIKAFYTGRLTLGLLNEWGTGIDVLSANAMTESYGTVPSSLSVKELKDALAEISGIDLGAKLDHVINYISMKAKFLERREPGYTDPLNTPHRVSVGAHHVLLSTALSLLPVPSVSSFEARAAEIADLVCRIPALSLVAADFAVRYFNRSHAMHLNQPPLLAATYNAGSPRSDPTNAWNLKQYGRHIDRWLEYYNTSRLLS
jgi:hypothetical protein